MAVRRQMVETWASWRGVIVCLTAAERASTLSHLHVFSSWHSAVCNVSVQATVEAKWRTHFTFRSFFHFVRKPILKPSASIVGCRARQPEMPSSARCSVILAFPVMVCGRTGVRLVTAAINVQQSLYRPPGPRPQDQDAMAAQEMGTTASYVLMRHSTQPAIMRHGRRNAQALASR